MIDIFINIIAMKLSLKFDPIRPPRYFQAKQFFIRLFIGIVASNLVLPLIFFCKLPLLKRPFRLIFIRILDNTKLFNIDWYTSRYPDVVEKKISPQLHFLLHGEREGRLPNPFFEPFFYRSKIPNFSRNSNSLLHYYFVGWLLRLSPSPSFDINFYFENNKDVASLFIEPLQHYYSHGGREGRSPNHKFDGQFYLKTYKEVLEMGITPLEHYLSYGKSAGYHTSETAYSRVIHLSKLPPNLNKLKPLRKTSTRGVKPVKFSTSTLVDIIIPVYSGYNETLRAITSVLISGKNSKTPFELVVINDACPDSKLNKALDGMAKNGLFTYIVNPKNLGFVGTVNKGMRLHANRDVVLLNADTKVSNDWLDRLRSAANTYKHIASVTPLSNNASICSYPDFLQENPFALEIDWSELDLLAKSLNRGELLQLPTGHGFCLYLKRKAIKAIGLFDQKAFGKGYGEENDWCIRAEKSGWINVAALNIFVFHEGSISFGQHKKELLSQGLGILNARYPDYSSSVNAFIESDPMMPYRRKLDWARLERQVKTKNVLMVSHSRGGGVERHIREETQKLLSLGVGVFYLRPDYLNEGCVLISSPISGLHSNIELLLFANTTELAHSLRRLKITEIHDHGLVDFTYYADDYLNRLVKELNVDYLKTIHDYKIICPRLNLVNTEGVYCQEAEAFDCNVCLNSKNNIFGVSDINAWRKMQHESLKLANQILVPDQDVLKRVLRYYPDLNIEIAPHSAIEPKPIKNFSHPAKITKNVEVMVIGAIGDIKGYQVLLDCAKHARKNKLPIIFKLMGYSMSNKELEESGVVMLGEYADEGAVDLCRKYNPDLIWLPSIWPETYSYTLDIALEVGFPVMAFDIGAVARRLGVLKNYPKLVIPLCFQKNPELINKSIMNTFSKKRNFLNGNKINC